MKRFKQFLSVTLLVLTLGISAYAGDIDMPGHVPPPPPPPASAPGDMSEPTAAPGDISTPGFAEVALNLLLDVMSVF